MAANKITIKFNSQGDRALLKALKNLAKAQDNLTRTTKKFGKAQDNTAKGGRLLNNTFATMRSKLLLFNFAMALGVRQLGEFVKEAGKVQDMERAFTNLSGGGEKASVAMGKLKQATNGTMSQFDLFQQANNAMILGVSKNSDEMAHMFDVAQRLGAALGKDTKHSVESLITGIGRQSRLMLDNIGIIVKADKAYENYAAGLGISADKLSDSEKKQAFLNATMEAAEEKLLKVGKEVISYNAKIQIAGARMADMRVELGDRLLPLLSTLAHHFTDTAIIKGYGTALGLVTLGYGYYRKAAILAAFATVGFKVALQRLMTATGLGFAIALLGELAGRFFFVKEATNELTGSFKKQGIVVTDIKERTKALVEEEKKQFLQRKRLVQVTKDLMNAFDFPSPLWRYSQEAKEALELVVKWYGKSKQAQIEALEVEKVMLELGAARWMQDNKNMALSNEYFMALQNVDKAIEKLKSGTTGLTDAEKELNEQRKRALSLLGAAQTNMMSLLVTEQEHLDSQEQLAIAQAELLFSSNEMEAQLLNAKETIKEHFDDLEDERILRQRQQYIQKLEDSNIFYASSMAGYDQFVTSLTDMDMDGKTRREVIWDATKDALIRFMGDYLKELIISKIAQEGVATATQTASIASSVVTGQSIAAAYAAASAAASLASFGANAVPAAAGITSVHALTKSLATFEQGGLVGGRRHSSGGTMIEAEKGEFVMSRNAVESVGIEAMNRINSGGGSGAVSINFTGNVMSQDFIEDEAIPMIKEAIRRGADIGVA